MTYACDRCHYTTHDKSHYTAHLNRKKQCSPDTGVRTYAPTPAPEGMQLCGKCHKHVVLDDFATHAESCTGVDSVTCQFCLKTGFCKKANRDRHMLVCKKRPNEQLNTQPPSTTTTIHNNITNVTNNNTTNNITNNITYVHVAFGQENLDHIFNLPRHELTKYLRSLLANPTEGVFRFVKDKHFNPELPQYQNIRKINKHSLNCEYFNGKDWSTDIAHEVVRKMLKAISMDYTNMIDQHFEQGKTIPDSVIDSFMDKIGDIFEVDVTGDHYDRDEPIMSFQEIDSKIKPYIRSMTEYIYEYTKKLLQKM